MKKGIKIPIKDSQKNVQNYKDNFDIFDDDEKSSINMDDNSPKRKNKNNKNAHISEDEKEKEDSDKDEKNNKEQKEILLKKAKNEYTFFKNNYIINYKNEKESFMKEFNKEFNYKKNLEIEKLQQELDEDLSQYEKDLENKMKLELEKYKKELIEDYEEDNKDINNENINSNNFQIKKSNLESQIRIQKAKNKTKKEIEEKKRKNKLEENENHLSEMNEIKRTRLEQQNKNKIDKLIEEIKNDFDRFVRDIKDKNKNDLTSNIFLNQNEDSSLKEILEQYSKELESQLEFSKNSLKIEYEQKLQNELETLKNNVLTNSDSDSFKYNENKKEIENEYYSEITTIKKRNKENLDKLNETLKDIIEKTSNEFDIIKTKENNDINKSMKEIKEKIKEINNINQEDNNSLLEDYISSDLISKKKVIMSKYNSLVNMLEGEYIQNKLLIKYYIDIINSINQKLSLNQRQISIDEIINDIFNLINNYKEIYSREKNQKLFPILFNAFNKVMNLMFNDDNMINIIDNSIYGQNIINNENNITNMNMTNNLIINSKLNETLNNINNTRLLSSFSPRKNTNNEQIFNKTFTKDLNIQQRYNNESVLNNININNTTNEINNNINNNKITIPEISKDLLDKLSKDNLYKYNIIQDFLINESKNIINELNLYSQKKNSENRINILYQSGEFAQYNNIFNRIFQEENDKTNQYFRSINSKSKIFEILKKNIKDNFIFIEKYSDKINIVNNKFNQIMNNIEEYKNNYYGVNKIIGRRSNPYYKNNIENMMNNTFNIESNNRNYYNQKFFA